MIIESMAKKEEAILENYKKILEKLDGIEQKVDTLHTIINSDYNSPEFKNAVKAVLNLKEKRGHEVNSYNSIPMESLIERDWEIKNNKVKTGDRRLDDLLVGGIPIGSNVAIYGPPYTGKEVTINQFIADGLHKEIPVICILTDGLVNEFKEELSFLRVNTENYEKKGLLRYVDAFSQSIEVEEKNPNAIIVDKPGNIRAILKEVDLISTDLLKAHSNYRLAFRSLSSVICATGIDKTYETLQKFVGKRKNEKAVSMYAIDKGMHDEQDVHKVFKLMDGAIEYKIEQLKTFLCIKGIGDVQTRTWVDYTYSRCGLNIGSFCLSDVK